MRKEKDRERLLWTGLTGGLLVLVLLFAFSTNAIAQSADRDNQRLLSLFYQVLEFVQHNYVDESKTDAKRLVEGALKGMLESLDDPHTAYLNEQEMRGLTDTTRGEFGGVGLYILKTDRGVEVARPIDGTPAYRVGMLAGDLIVAVDKEPALELSVDEVVKRLRGAPGSNVTMTVQRGGGATFDVTITRAVIEIPTVRSAMMPNGVGYLLVTQFTPNSAPQVREAIASFDKQRYSSLIIDLRSNPGGLLNGVVDVADFFFERGTTIVSTKSRIASENRVYEARGRAIVPRDKPIVVLIDRYSASAAEILTGALKDLGRATIMGEKSYGKGSVQQVLPIETGGGFRLTTARYYTPSGKSIDKIGIEPDRAVKQPEYTDEEIASARKLLETNRVQEFVRLHPKPSEASIAEFVAVLKSQGITLREERIRKNVRDEVNRIAGESPVYDLEYDKVLQEAVAFVGSPAAAALAGPPAPGQGKVAPAR
jgi:carboxyl-terminal processing protease